MLNVNQIKDGLFAHGPLLNPGAKIIKQLEKNKFQIISGGKVIYEGEMKNGKEHGEGIEYFYYKDDKNGLAKYVGNYKNGTRHGYGQSYVMRNCKTVPNEDGIFENGYLKEGKVYQDGVLEYEGEVKTKNEIVKMDIQAEMEEKARKKAEREQKYTIYDPRHYEIDDSGYEVNHFDKYRKINRDYLYHGIGQTNYNGIDKKGEPLPNFIGKFDRNKPSEGIAYYNSSVFTKDKLRELSSYTDSHKTEQEKDKNISDTVNKYRDNNIQMGTKTNKFIHIDREIYDEDRPFLEVEKEVGKDTCKYKLYKSIYDNNKIYRQNDAGTLDEQQYLLAKKHLKGVWNVPKKLGKKIGFGPNDNNGETVEYSLNEDMAMRIAKYLDFEK